MSRGWKLAILIFHISIVTVSLGLLYFAYAKFEETTKLQQTPAASVEIYYAAQKIPKGEIITREMLGTFKLPPQYVADVTFTTYEEDSLVGQITHYTIDQGVVITSSMLEPEPQTTSGPTLQDVLDQLDRDLQEALRSNMAYSVPETMTVGETVTIELLLNPALSKEQLDTQFAERSDFPTSTPEANQLVTEQGGETDIISAEVDITDRMKAVLLSPTYNAFDIQSLHENDEQILSNFNTTKWRWSVTAKSPGEQDLQLTIYRLIKYNGNERWREVKFDRSSAAIHVRPLPRLTSINWNQLIAILLTAVLIPVFLYWYDGRKEKCSGTGKN